MAQQLDSVEESDATRSFNWLGRSGRGSAYISYNAISHLPATSFDFGNEGYAASCNYGGELLQLSAPSSLHGLIFVRGDFSPSLHASLARRQQEKGGPATFGLKVSRDKHNPHPSQLFGFSSAKPGYRLGRVLERGSFNYRWPYTEYSLVHNKELEDLKSWRMIKNDLAEKILKEGLRENGSFARTKGHLKIMDTELVQKTDKIFLEKKLFLCDNSSRSSWKEIRETLCRRKNEDCHKSFKPDTNTTQATKAEEYGLDRETYRAWYRKQLENSRRKLENEVGTCSIFSFVKEGVLYQILRIGSDPSFKADDSSQPGSRIELTIGGPTRFHHHDPFTWNTKKNPLEVDGRKSEPPKGTINYETDKDSNCLTVYDSSQSIALQARVFQLLGGGKDEHYKPIRLSKSKCMTNHSGEICHMHIRSGLTQRITLIAAFRLFESSNNPETTWSPAMPTSSEVYGYIGGDIRKPTAATAALWPTILHERYLHGDYLSPLTDVHLIGRCFEKIMHVDIIPQPGHHATNSSKTTPFLPNASTPTSQCSEPRDLWKGPLALVGNVFTNPEINYCTLFWKVRFLVKVYKFFNEIENSWHFETLSQGASTNSTTHSLSPSLSKDVPPTRREVKSDSDRSTGPDAPSSNKIQAIAREQSLLIEKRLEGVVLFLIQRLTHPSSSSSMSRYKTTAQPDFYYIMITIWFCIYNLPNAGWRRDLMKQVTELDARKSGLGNDDDDFAIAKEDTIPLLQWYQYGSILRLSEKGYFHPDWNRDNVLATRVNKLRNAALVASAAKASSGRPYLASDEVVDRLEFLAYELDLEGQSFKSGDHTIASFARRRIKDRLFTTSLSPGFRVDGAEYHTDGPWELHALCHHSRLMIVKLERSRGDQWRRIEQIEAEVELYKGKLCQFLNSEATVTPCWERSYREERKSWDQSEATAIVGSTFLSLPNIERTLRNPERPSPEFKVSQLASSAIVQTEALKDMTLMDSWRSRQYHTIERGLRDAGPIQWESWRPPRLYHPENFIVSLDDTPHLYKSPEISKKAIPSEIREFVDGPQEVGGFSIINFAELYMSDKIGVADLVETEGGEEYSGSVICAGFKIPGTNKEDLVERLHDSLVDLNVRHRFLAVASQNLKHQSNKKLLNLLVYVMCPSSAACLSNHLLKLSSFTLQNQNDWIARITIIGWKRCQRKKDDKVFDRANPKDDMHEDGNESQQEDDETISLPPDFDLVIYEDDEKRRKQVDEKSIHWEVADEEAPRESDSVSIDAKKFRECNLDCLEFESFELQVSSFVLATNPFGDFSKCTIISEEIDGEELQEIAEKAQRVWRWFVHQPQTARCLVFFLLLGKLIRDMIAQYRHAVDALRSILVLDQCLKPNVEKWPDEPGAIQRLQHAIWSLESLYKLQRSLGQSLKSIEEAKEQIYAEIKDGASARSESLEGICQQHIDSFESCYVRLCAKAIELERVIELNTRYKEASETILNLTNSRTSIRQSRTVERLTYLTILYLPMSLMAAIFAIPPEQKTVLPHMGTRWFTGGTVLMLLVTSFIALYILEILGAFKTSWIGCKTFIKNPLRWILHFWGKLKKQAKVLLWQRLWKRKERVAGDLP